MKKLMVACLIGAMSLSLTACGTAKKSTEHVAVAEEKGAFADLTSMPQFEVNDMNDNVVTQDILKENEFTVINIWGTFCKACIDELPMLQEIADEYESKGVGMLGIVADGDANNVKAFEILKKSKVDFTNLAPNEQFQKDFVSKVTAVPVTVLVNNKGEILETVVGAKQKEEYIQLIENHLNEAK